MQFITTSYIIPAFLEKVFNKILSQEFNMDVAKTNIETKKLTDYFRPNSKEYQCLSQSFRESDLYILYVILIETNFRNNIYHGKDHKFKENIEIYLWHTFTKLILNFEGDPKP